mmetsp:Transcript_67899/g.189604  ORF Transcript_67899/g.189604 Transcript_67899/m.189604 type:complete len:294 (+) Transcript_67899:466-1347(+)
MTLEILDLTLHPLDCVNLLEAREECGHARNIDANRHHQIRDVVRREGKHVDGEHPHEQSCDADDEADEEEAMVSRQHDKLHTVALAHLRIRRTASKHARSSTAVCALRANLHPRTTLRQLAVHGLRGCGGVCPYRCDLFEEVWAPRAARASLGIHGRSRRGRRGSRRTHRGELNLVHRLPCAWRVLGDGRRQRRLLGLAVLHAEPTQQFAVVLVLRADETHLGKLQALQSQGRHAVDSRALFKLFVADHQLGLANRVHGTLLKDPEPTFHEAPEVLEHHFPLPLVGGGKLRIA